MGIKFSKDFEDYFLKDNREIICISSGKIYKNLKDCSKDIFHNQQKQNCFKIYRCCTDYVKLKENNLFYKFNNDFRAVKERFSGLIFKDAFEAAEYFKCNPENVLKGCLKSDEISQIWRCFSFCDDEDLLI